MSSEEQDVIASVIEHGQNDGHEIENTGVGQDEGTNNEESSQEKTGTESERYQQSRADKLFAENQQLKQYEKVGKFLESRPDVAQTVLNEISGQPKAQEERVTLKSDEFDPWEAYNDPSSVSYKFRIQEMQETINGAVDKAVGGLKAQQGRTSLRADLTNKGLNEQEVNSFFEFADKHPSEYGLDNVLKMWRAVSQAPETVNDNPLDKIRQNQNNLTPAGTISGAQPGRKSEEDKVWSAIMGSGDRTKF